MVFFLAPYLLNTALDRYETAYFVADPSIPTGRLLSRKFSERVCSCRPRSDIRATMNLTAEQLRIASMIDAKMQNLVGAGNDDITILTEMFDYMPGFKRLMDTSESDAMDELCQRFAGFFRYAKTLEMLATGIQSGAIKVPK